MTLGIRDLVHRVRNGPPWAPRRDLLLELPAEVVIRVMETVLSTDGWWTLRTLIRAFPSWSKYVLFISDEYHYWDSKLWWVSLDEYDPSSPWAKTTPIKIVVIWSLAMYQGKDDFTLAPWSRPLRFLDKSTHLVVVNSSAYSSVERGVVRYLSEKSISLEDSRFSHDFLIDGIAHFNLDRDRPSPGVTKMPTEDVHAPSIKVTKHGKWRFNSVRPLRSLSVKSSGIHHLAYFDTFKHLKTMSIHHGEKCHLSLTEDCIPTVFAFRAPKLKRLRLAYTSSCTPQVAIVPEFMEEAEVAIINEKWNYLNPYGELSCNHARQGSHDQAHWCSHNELYYRSFPWTMKISRAHYVGVSDLYVLSKNFRSMKFLYWDRLCSVDGCPRLVRWRKKFVDCPELKDLRICSVVKKVSRDKNPIISFRAPKLETLTLVGLKDSSYTWNLPHLLNGVFSPTLTVVHIANMSTSLNGRSPPMFLFESLAGIADTVKSLYIKGYEVSFTGKPGSGSYPVVFEQLDYLWLDITYISFVCLLDGHSQHGCLGMDSPEKHSKPTTTIPIADKDLTTVSVSSIDSLVFPVRKETPVMTGGMPIFIVKKPSDIIERSSRIAIVNLPEWQFPQLKKTHIYVSALRTGWCFDIQCKKLGFFDMDVPFTCESVEISTVIACQIRVNDKMLKETKAESGDVVDSERFRSWKKIDGEFAEQGIGYQQRDESQWMYDDGCERRT